MDTENMTKKLNVIHWVGLVALGLFFAGSAQAVTYYNLTHQDSAGNATPGANDSAVINNAIFATPDNNTIVGTGVLQPFIRIQPPTNTNCGGGHPCTEAGYNTDGHVTAAPKGNVNTAQFEGKDNEGTNWNHALQLNNIGTV